MNLLDRLLGREPGQEQPIASKPALIAAERQIRQWATCQEMHLYRGDHDLDSPTRTLKAMDQTLRQTLLGLIFVEKSRRYPELDADIGHLQQRLRQRLDGPTKPISDAEDDDFRLACQNLALRVNWEELRELPFRRAPVRP